MLDGADRSWCVLHLLRESVCVQCWETKAHGLTPVENSADEVLLCHVLKAQRLNGA